MSSWDTSMLPRWATPRNLDASNGTYNNYDQTGISNTVNEEEDPNDALAASREILDRLRKWDQWWVRRRESLASYLLSKIYPRPPPCPSQPELRRLALAFFPPRATGIKVELCDIDLKSKPDWVTVRWMLVHSLWASVHENIRDSFIKAGVEAGSRVAWYEHAGQDLSCEATSRGNWVKGPGPVCWIPILESTLPLRPFKISFYPDTQAMKTLFSSALCFNAITEMVGHRYDICAAVPANMLPGFGLTLSPLAGTSFINQTWVQELSSQPNKRAANDKKSVIGYFMNSQLKRDESINLVREYISCMDEVSQVHSIAKRKLDFLEKLQKDYEDVLANPDLAEQVDVPQDRSVLVADAQTCELAIKSIKSAMGRIRAEHEELPGILSDLKSSLHDLFQLRTIEQNELAIMAESNNKAILVFTVVTIVFLPLSFFTSYFGMNIENTSAVLSGQGYFWGVCGSITLVIVTFTLLYGFKDRLYGWLWGNRHSPGGAELYYRPNKH
ncbi:MAG: hypothetical protein LQ344_004837 [Seirophora lacunosa]|nr:MAG: hypothetical protein LQ344_004837 [Seirophora lacunosa]